MAFVPGRLFQPSLMFVVKAGSLFCRPRLTHKYWTRVERNSRDIHSSLLGPFVGYEENKVLRIRPQVPTLMARVR